MARLEQKDPDARIQHPERIYPSNEDIIAIEDIIARCRRVGKNMVRD